MDREYLKILTQTFLKTFGYMPKPTKEKHGVLFSRPTGLGVTDELLVYFHEAGEDDIIRYALTQLKEGYERVPGGKNGRRFFLSPYSIGKVPLAVVENDFYYQIPVWFFDREFSGQKKLTPLKKLEEDTAKYEQERIEQPYTSKTDKGHDLLSHLLKQLESPDEPLLRIIIAPAGYGKTVLMGTLYTKLKQTFMANKNSQCPGARPLLMLPGHLKRATSLDGLVNNFIGDEYDYGIANADTFGFWVRNNMIVWLIDGLEELILRIPEEFIFSLLEQYIFASDSQTPQIVMAIRKPILVTSPDLRYTIEEWEGTGLKIYDLSNWGRVEQKKYFFKNLRLDQIDIQNFITDVSTSHTLRDICIVPYYCSLVADLKNNNQMAIFKDECELIEYAVERLCEREADKGLDLEIVPISTQKELFSDLAEESYEGNNITQRLLREYVEVYLDNMDPVVRNDQIACLLRHALLTKMGDDLDFMQDSLKQYFFGLFLLKYLKANQVKVFDNKEIEPDSLTAQYLIRSASEINWNRIMENELHKLPSSTNEIATGFRNLMRIFLTANLPEKESLIKRNLQNRNLTGLVFQDLNLTKFEFQHSSLNDVKFIRCNLTRANFDGCHLKNTFFDSHCKIMGATTRGAIKDVIRTETKILDNRKAIDRYFYEKTQIPIEQKAPCQAFINLRKVLVKIVRRGVGYQMPKKFLLMTKCTGGVPAEKCVEACIENKIISESGARLRIRTNLFNQVEPFVKDQEVTTTIKIVLDEICLGRNIGCQHVYK